MFLLLVDGDVILLAFVNGSFIVATNVTSDGQLDSSVDTRAFFLLYCIVFFDTTVEVSDHQYLPN